MNAWIDPIMMLVVLSNLALLGSSRLGACIRLVAFQGLLLALLPQLVYQDGDFIRPILISLGTLGLKGLAFPWLLSRALQEANVRHEVEPFLGFTPSLLIGVLILAISTRLAARLPLPPEMTDSLSIAVALFTMMTGLLLIVSRIKALTQVIGYLVLENGIFIVGISLAQHEPLLVELGILLDVFAAVFVMGITLFHINREFDHIDTDRLSALKDWNS